MGYAFLTTENTEFAEILEGFLCVLREARSQSAVHSVVKVLDKPTQ